MSRKKKPTQPRKAVSLATIPERVANRVPRGDMGATGQAMRHGLVVEPVVVVTDDGEVKESPNGMKRARRIDLVEMYGKKHILAQRQVMAAKVLRNAYENTLRSPDAIKAVQVDCSPKPDQAVAMMIDRVSQFSEVMGLVSAPYKEIIDCVVLNNCIPAWLPKYRGPNYQRGIKHMQEALEDLADMLDL